MNNTQSKETLDLEEDRRSELGEPIELKIMKADPQTDSECIKEKEKSFNKEDIDSQTESKESKTEIQVQTWKEVEDILELPDADIRTDEFQYLP